MITYDEAIGIENIDAVVEECNKMVKEMKASNTSIPLAERVVLNRIVALLGASSDLFLAREVAKTSVALAWALGKGLIDLDKYDNIEEAIIDRTVEEGGKQ